MARHGNRNHPFIGAPVRPSPAPPPEALVASRNSTMTPRGHPQHPLTKSGFRGPRLGSKPNGKGAYFFFATFFLAAGFFFAAAFFATAMSFSFRSFT